MSSNIRLNIQHGFKRTDASVLNGHPLRGNLKDKIAREHLLQGEDFDSRKELGIMIRDTVISVMGVASAIVPFYIAFQSMTGA
jgi:hypothetical protein